MKRLRDFMKGIQNKKEKRDDAGSSFVLVMVSIALIMILVAIVFVMIFMQYKMLALGKQSKDNFYYLEEVLDEMRVGVGNESVKQLKSAYDETVSMVVAYDTNQQKYMSVSAETAENILQNKFFNNIEQVYGLSPDNLCKLLLSYVQDVNVNSVTITGKQQKVTTMNGVEITLGDGTDEFRAYELVTSNPKKTVGYAIKNITVSRTDEKGNLQSITTDISIYPPKEALNFLGSALDLENVFTYAMVADYGVDLSGGKTTDVRITGNVYAGSDTRNNGIYGGTIDPTNNVITDSTNGGDGKTDESLYSGIFVSDPETALNLQSDIVAVNGSIAAKDGALIKINTKSDDSSMSASTNLWANNIVTLGDTGSNIQLKAQCSISDDLELNGEESTVYLSGKYFGYNYAAEEEYAEQSGSATSTVKNQISAVKGKTHTNSSAIMVNGEKSTLDLSQLEEMVINGRSYIDVVSENPATAAGDTDYTDVDIKTAESISQKGNQLVYRVTEPRPASTALTALNTTGTKTVGSNDNLLTTGVPTYNMIKFLTYQFFQDKGYLIYKTKEGNDLYSATWAGIDSDSYEDVWADIKADGENSPYYKDILQVYFPTDKKIQAKKSGDKYLRNSSKQIVYELVDNDQIEVTDCYNNKYKIWDNAGSLVTVTDATEKGIVSGINRYGFVTVGADYDLVSLVKTVSGASKETYYYYQFYDEDAKEEFVLDYAGYSAADPRVDDVTSKETFDSETIVLPDAYEKTVYTRGISTVLEAEAEKYELKPAEKKNSTYDEIQLMKLYQEKVNRANVYKCYFPKSEASITTTQETVAKTLYENGTRSLSAGGTFKYTTKGNDISPLTNPECIAINWSEVADKEVTNGGMGAELKGYTGARVWISTGDITIDGSKFGGNKTSGIVLCKGDVTFKNLQSFNGTVICAGKIYITGTTKFNADEQMCNGMLQNDKENMIRTCLGLNAYKVDNDDSYKEKSISSIEYTDLVGFENWIKNGE